MENVAQGDGDVDLLERRSLCLSSSTPGLAAHCHDEGFQDTVRKHFSTQESNATEQLCLLKARLSKSNINDFWTELLEGMNSMTGSQYSFVAKRILVDDQDSAVEMPSIGEPGSCLMGVAFYYDDGGSNRAHHRDYKYLAYGAPCSYMKHDKVFMIPEGLPEFVTDNPNEFVFPIDAYLGLPLFYDGRCFAHFGTMWSVDGLKRRGLSWGFVEIILHALEEIIIQRLVEGHSFAKATQSTKDVAIIPQAAVTVAQSLKPYARSLSHELRTPMQGVVGMLEIMHATVQESLDAHPDGGIREIFRTLRDNIEVVQGMFDVSRYCKLRELTVSLDSSRRAVEAADNVVHAYDMNMRVPDTPDPLGDDGSLYKSIEGSSHVVPHDKINDGIGVKRRGSLSFESSEGRDPKRLAIRSRSGTIRSTSPRTGSLRSTAQESGLIEEVSTQSRGAEVQMPIDDAMVSNPEQILNNRIDESVLTSSLRLTKIRELLHDIINESIRIGGRPESAVAEDTRYGEIIEVRSRCSNGNEATKTVEWLVNPSVPDEIYVDERDLAKLMSELVLNAIKFTERGKILVTATLSPKSRYIIVIVKDTGSGIPESFRPHLFKPFSREDDSITRQNEGLGLGLLVAKGLARKIGGDLTCLRSATEGAQQGSEFEVRIPLSPSEIISRYSTPSCTPTPSHVSGDEGLPIPRTSGRQNYIRDERRSSCYSLARAEEVDPVASCETRSPALVSSPSRGNSLNQPSSPSARRSSTKKPPKFDRNLAKKHPLSILVAEDNRINRKLLVSMLSRLGYTTIHEAFDGAEAVRLMDIDRAMRGEKPINLVLMDIWMPNMDGYEAAKRIFAMDRLRHASHAGEDGDPRWKQESRIQILAVTADVTDEALSRAKEAGMAGILTKPYGLMDLERAILEHCTELNG